MLESNMTKFKNLFFFAAKLFSGFLAFFIIWLICLAASPIFLVIIGAKYAQEFIAEKTNKKLAPQKELLYVPATKDNNIHSAN